MSHTGKTRGYETLFHRHAANPILTAADWPYPAHTRLQRRRDAARATARRCCLCRVEDRRGHSHLCAARSANGVDGWVIDEEPTLLPDPEHYPEELWGIEDPRITFVDELGKYAIAYTAFSKGGPGVALALTEDFRTLRALRPRHAARRQGRGAACRAASTAASRSSIARCTDSGAHVWISYSPDLRNWGGHKLMLPARKGAWWDANKVGLSPPLIETPRGWLMLYHGVRHTASGCLYRLGARALRARQAGALPRCAATRGSSGPRRPTSARATSATSRSRAATPSAPTATRINLYYGAADTLHRARDRQHPRSCSRWLDEHGTAT